MMRKRIVYFISCVFPEELERSDDMNGLEREWSGCSLVRNERIFSSARPQRGELYVQRVFKDYLDRNTDVGRGGYVRTTYQETLQKLDCCG